MKEGYGLSLATMFTVLGFIGAESLPRQYMSLLWHSVVCISI